MAARFKVGDIITVITPAYAAGTVDVVVKVGRRWLGLRRASDSRADPTTFRLDLASHSTIVLLGDRSDAINELGRLRNEYEAAYRKYRSERQIALQELERQWDAEHPWPMNTPHAYIVKLTKEATDGNTSTDR